MVYQLTDYITDIYIVCRIRHTNSVVQLYTLVSTPQYANAFTP